MAHLVPRPTCDPAVVVVHMGGDKVSARGKGRCDSGVVTVEARTDEKDTHPSGPDWSHQDADVRLARCDVAGDGGIDGDGCPVTDRDVPEDD